MNSVNKTLYIPLYGKAFVSRKGIILNDKKAEEIWEAEGFSLKGKSKSKWLAYYMGMRSAVFDQWLLEQMQKDSEAIVLHIGCGMDSRVLRVGTKGHQWYDIDFPDVISERGKYYAEDDTYYMVEADVREQNWLSKISKANHAIIVMEGVSMYFKPQELKVVLEQISSHFEVVNLLMDAYTTMAAKASKYKNPINDVGVTQVYGLDEPKVLENGKLTFCKEHEMTPAEKVNELEGFERTIFKKLYSGGIAKKMYRMYEYVQG
ncbi:MAG: class I SAM-dependent methyltransferase [Agathobacter sp.]|nr:class I SAM-dependent methyltransferase [Agathobacter sp.]